MRWTHTVAVLVLAFAAGGCASTAYRAVSTFGLAPEGYGELEDNRYTLYDEAQISLGTFGAQPVSDIIDELAEDAQSSGSAHLRWRLQLLAGGRVLRVVRTENYSPVGFHFLLREQQVPTGLILKLQPIIVWQRSMRAGEPAEPLTRADSLTHLSRLRQELFAIADRVRRQTAGPTADLGDRR